MYKIHQNSYRKDNVWSSISDFLEFGVDLEELYGDDYGYIAVDRSGKIYAYGLKPIIYCGEWRASGEVKNQYRLIAQVTNSSISSWTNQLYHLTENDGKVEISKVGCTISDTIKVERISEVALHIYHEKGEKLGSVIKDVEQMYKFYPRPEGPLALNSKLLQEIQKLIDSLNEA